MKPVPTPCAGLTFARRSGRAALLTSLHRWLFACMAAFACMCLAAGASAQAESRPAQGAGNDDGAIRSLVDYTVPDLTLVREDGKHVSLKGELDDGRPVVLAFIYTSCSALCPILSHVMADLQERLGPARDRVHLVSISIDPEYDTPARLRAYAQRFAAGAEWHYYTGTPAAIREVQRAFGAYRGDKMDHVPAILIRPSPQARWVRIDGFATPDELLAELPAHGMTK